LLDPDSFAPDFDASVFGFRPAFGLSILSADSVICQWLPAGVSSSVAPGTRPRFSHRTIVGKAAAWFCPLCSSPGDFNLAKEKRNA
jgi:hypothetical protein